MITIRVHFNDFNRNTEESLPSQNFIIHSDPNATIRDIKNTISKNPIFLNSKCCNDYRLAIYNDMGPIYLEDYMYIKDYVNDKNTVDINMWAPSRNFEPFSNDHSCQQNWIWILIIVLILIIIVFLFFRRNKENLD